LIFIQRLIDADPELKELMKFGRRNVSLLTIAPTGSVSLMTQTTSGIEPAFLVAYKRRRKINPNDKNIRVDFIDENGDSWEEYTVVHHKFKVWMDINGYDISDMDKYSTEDLNEMVKKSPYFKATSADVNWVEKVQMQGDINLPEDASKEIVGKVYITAWKSGCKGVTVYRENSRAGVLVSDTKKTENVNEIIKKNDAPKRPKRLRCEILRFQNAKEKWIWFT